MRKITNKYAQYDRGYWTITKLVKSEYSSKANHGRTKDIGYEKVISNAYKQYQHFFMLLDLGWSK